MLGNFTTTAIITRGLHCGPACSGLITTPFSLYCTSEPIVPPPTGGGGGGYPGPAHNKTDNIQDFYKPVEVEQPYIVPPNKEADYLRKHTIVTLKMEIGKMKVEKIYKVAEKRAGSVVKIFKVVDVTSNRIKASITQLKRLTTRAKAFITKLRLK